MPAVTPEDRVTESDQELHVALELPRASARQIYLWAQNQPWPEGTELEKPGDYHITLLYTPQGHEQFKDAHWLEHMEQAEVKITGISAFASQEQGYAYVLRVESEEIQQKAEEMQGRAEWAGLPITKFPGGYKPHITVGYGPSSRLTGVHPPNFQFDVGPSSVSPPRLNKEGRTAQEIDDWIYTLDGHGPFRVVDMTNEGRQPEYIVRMDPESKDASDHPGQEGVDWEYVYLPANEVRLAKTSEYNGWSNWETWNAKLMMDNERHHYDAMHGIVEQGGGPEELRQHFEPNLIGPYNRERLQEAQDWNAIHPDERRRMIDERDRAEFGDAAVDMGRGLMDAGGLWNDPGKDDTAELIDPHMVNWDEIHHNILSEYPDDHPLNQQYQNPAPLTFPQEWTSRSAAMDDYGNELPWWETAKWGELLNSQQIAEHYGLVPSAISNYQTRYQDFPKSILPEGQQWGKLKLFPANEVHEWFKRRGQGRTAPLNMALSEPDPRWMGPVTEPSLQEPEPPGQEQPWTGYKRGDPNDIEENPPRGSRLASKAPEPPNYRHHEKPGEKCSTCKMFDHEQKLCWGFGNKKVSPEAVCDDFYPEHKRSAYSPDEVKVLDHLSLTNVAANLHYKFAEGGLDPQAATDYAKRMLKLIGYPPDDITVQAALQAWQQLYPDDRIEDNAQSANNQLNAPTVPTKSWGYGTHSKTTATPTHHNRWTGLPCNCPWHYQDRQFRSAARLAGQHINKVMKAPDKVYRTPEGEAFRQQLAKDLGEEHDALAPYLAQRWKKGEVRLGVDHPTRLDPRLYVQSYGDHRYDLNPGWIEGINMPRSGYWRMLSPTPMSPGPLARWSQWYNARQHPTRQGVNVMDPNFTVHDIDAKANEHQRALEEERQLADMNRLGQTVHTFPAQPGGGIDWDDAFESLDHGRYDRSYEDAFHHLMRNESYPDPYHSDEIEEMDRDFAERHFPSDHDYEEQLAQHQHDQQNRREDLVNAHEMVKKNHSIPARQAGWHIKQLTADPSEAREALEHEGCVMGHCIGSNEQPYKNLAEKGKIDAFSLRDPKGRPHVTWHYNSDGSLAEIFGPNDDPVKPEYQQMLDEWGSHTGMDTDRGYAVGNQEVAGIPEWRADNPETMDAYLNQYGDNADLWGLAHDSGEDVDEDTQAYPGEPQWNDIAQNMMGHGYTWNPVSGDTWDTNPDAVANTDQVKAMYNTAADEGHLPGLHSAINEYEATHPNQQAVMDQWNRLVQPHYHPQTGQLMNEPVLHQFQQPLPGLQPGGTFSRVWLPEKFAHSSGELCYSKSQGFGYIARETLPQEQRRWEGISAPAVHTFPDNWTVHQIADEADMHSVGRFMRNCWQGGMSNQDWIDRKAGYGQRPYSLHDENGLPRAAFWIDHEGSGTPMALSGMRNQPPPTGTYKRLFTDWLGKSTPYETWQQEQLTGPIRGTVGEPRSAALTTPQLYHWLDASQIHDWMDESHTGPGQTFLTETGDDPHNNWNPDVPQFDNPVRLTIDPHQLDPNGFDPHYEGWLGNHLYTGAIPQGAITDIKSFKRPDEWDEQFSTVPSQVNNPEDHWRDGTDPSKRVHDIQFSNDFNWHQGKSSPRHVINEYGCHTSTDHSSLKRDAGSPVFSGLS